VFLVYGLVFAIGHAGTSNPVVGVMISRWFVRRRGIANSVAVSGNAVGQLVIIALLTVFLAEIGWRRSFGILGIANLIIAVPLLLVAVRSWLPTEAKAGEASPADRAAMLAETSVGSPFGGPPSILRSNQFWLLVFLYAICGFQDFFMATHVVAFSLDQGLGTVLAGNVLALMGLMGLVGVLSSGVLSDAFGPARPLALCFLMRIGIFALIMTVQSTAAILTFALLYGFTFLITAPLTVIFAGTIFGPARLGTVTGTISMVHQMSGGLGALAGALIFDHWGSYDGAFMLMLGLSIVAMVVSPLLQGKPMAQVEEGV
jgi:nitrate/nitrite transporter NarK